MQWLREHGCPWDASTCSNATGGGNLEVLQWARAHHCPWGELTCEYAARGGLLAVLQWARSRLDCQWDEAERAPGGVAGGAVAARLLPVG